MSFHTIRAISEGNAARNRRDHLPLRLLGQFCHPFVPHLPRKLRSIDGIQTAAEVHARFGAKSSPLRLNENASAHHQPPPDHRQEELRVWKGGDGMDERRSIEAHTDRVGHGHGRVTELQAGLVNKDVFAPDSQEALSNP